MFLSNLHRKQLAIFYFICFAVCYGWYCFHGLLLHQVAPIFFQNKLDLTVNLIMFTNLQHYILHNSQLQFFFDIAYFMLPLALCISCFFTNRLQSVLALVTSGFNLLYAVIVSATTPLSIEGFTGWIVLPLLFTFKSESSFYYMLHTLRYFFILIFFSSALWKIRAGGIFNMEQMSGALLIQHAAYLAGSQTDWFANFIKYLINHKQLSYFIYLMATIFEFVFIVGFFTKKYDKALIGVFLLFVVGDYFLMEINYFSWSAFLGCLWFSRFRLKV